MIEPVLKENYRRFSDITQADAAEFLIRDFYGINPLWVFAVIVVIVGLGWSWLRWLAGRPVVGNVPAADADDVSETTENVEVETDKPKESLPAAETGEKEAAVSEVAEIPPEITEPVSVPVLHFPTRSILALFPDAPQTQLYATVIGGALIILMFEVVIR